MSLKQYSNILGAPGTGIHSIRIFDLAVMDIVLTFVLAFIINKFIKQNYFIVLIACFVLGILLHRLFGVRTTIDKKIFN